jgi:phenylpyruvate tautomerase PptA (4-oxalocrotonate tautomerase family)
MPILDIEIVAPDSTESLPADLTQSLADAAAQVFEVGPGRVWVKLRILPSTNYAENGGLPEGLQPVFITVLESGVPDGRALKDEVIQLTKTIAKILGRPESNIHIFYQPDGAGRVAFGGKLVE